MKIKGDWDVQGQYMERNPDKQMELTQFGNSLRDEDGMVWAIKDEYGDWVNPTLARMGLKVKLDIA